MSRRENGQTARKCVTQDNADRVLHPAPALPSILEEYLTLGLYGLIPLRWKASSIFIYRYGWRKRLSHFSFSNSLPSTPPHPTLEGKKSRNGRATYGRCHTRWRLLCEESLSFAEWYRIQVTFQCSCNELEIRTKRRTIFFQWRT